MEIAFFLRWTSKELGTVLLGSILRFCGFGDISCESSYPSCLTLTRVVVGEMLALRSGLRMPSIICSWKRLSLISGVLAPMVPSSMLCFLVSNSPGYRYAAVSFLSTGDSPSSISTRVRYPPYAVLQSSVGCMISTTVGSDLRVGAIELFPYDISQSVLGWPELINFLLALTFSAVLGSMGGISEFCLCNLVPEMVSY